MTGGEFLQSFAWEDLQKNTGRETWRVENLLVVQHTMKAGMNYLYCPRPEFLGVNHASTFLENIAECAEREQSIFLKIDCSSDISLSDTSYKIISSQSLQPQRTIILDVSLPQEKLRAAMHEKTRYNIRVAEKKGVIVSRAARDARDADMFFSLLQETAARDRFRTHPKKYYQELLAVSSDGFSNELFCARYQGELLACALVNFYAPANTVTYLHGASLQKFRNVMAPYLLHWSIIQEAKKRNFQYYDFWGIDDDRWPGVTRFKKGFGGTLIEYPASRDIVFRPFWYRMYHYTKLVI